MNKRFKIERLPNKELPSEIEMKQLKSCTRTRGLIFPTYRGLVLKKNLLKSDIIFDKVENFGAYCVKDTFKNNKIIGWCLYIRGEIDGLAGIQSMYFTKKSYRGLGLGTLLFSKVVNIARKLNLPIWVYPDNDNKWFFRKIRTRYKNIHIENIYKVK